MTTTPTRLDKAGLQIYMEDLRSTFAPLVSPAFASVPTAPTASAGTSTSQLATCSFVQQELSGYSIPAATSQALGGVMVDGTTISVDASGVISVMLGNGDEVGY